MTFNVVFSSQKPSAEDVSPEGMCVLVFTFTENFLGNECINKLLLVIFNQLYSLTHYLVSLSLAY